MKISSVKHLLFPCFLTGDSPLIRGKHGIGKSDVVRTWAEMNGFHFEVLFLSHQEVGDLIGMPKTITGPKGEALHTWTKPSWLHRMEEATNAGKHCVLFLDELNRAPLDVRQAALQLVLDKHIHEHALPTYKGKQTLIVSAVNPANDDYQVEDLDAALLDRFNVIDAEEDVDGWLHWARENNVNKIMRKFIAKYPDRIYTSPKDIDEKGATPRGLTMVAKFMDIADQIEPEVLPILYAGKIGTVVASQLLEFIETYNDLVSLEDIEDEVNGFLLTNKLDIEEDKVEILQIITEKVKVLIDKLETIQQKDLIEEAVRVLREKNPRALLALLTAAHLETSFAVLSSLKSGDDKHIFLEVAELDRVYNNNSMFEAFVAQANRKK